MLSTEELLKPRYKVIADYPESCLEVGEVVVIGEGSDFFEPVEWWDKYPHLFKELEWWEDREEKDMPEYVKMRRKGIFKVKRYITGKYAYARLFEYPANVQLKTLTPATREEYEQYLSHQTKIKNDNNISTGAPERF